MIRIDFPEFPGEGWTSESDWDSDIQTPQPMRAAGRALEQAFGYLPALHLVNNWCKLFPFDHVLLTYVKRGVVPKFPVGIPVTEAMYELPPVQRVQDLFDFK